MEKPNFSDETLMAFADGELDPEAHKAVELAMNNDEDVFARVSMFKESSSVTKNVFASFLDVPVPDDLKNNIAALVDQNVDEKEMEDTTVVAFTPEPRQSKAAPLSYWALPMAASIALAVGLAAGFYAGGLGNDNRTDGLSIAKFDQPGLTQALVTVASGQEKLIGNGEDRLRIIATYKDSGGAICREFEVDQKDKSTVVAVACLSGEQWKIQFAVVAGQANNGYAPASSLESLDAYLSAVGASEPLTPEMENAALKALQ